jgi:hypothetical protein
MNSLLLDLPYSGSPGRRTLRVNFLVPLCRLVAECWDPDVGQVQSRAIDEAFRTATGGVDVGWLTYIADRLRKEPALGPEFIVEPVDGRGRIIVATKQRFSSSNPSHIARLRKVYQSLNGPIGHLGQ